MITCQGTLCSGSWWQGPWPLSTHNFTRQNASIWVLFGTFSPGQYGTFVHYFSVPTINWPLFFTDCRQAKVPLTWLCNDRREPATASGHLPDEKLLLEVWGSRQITQWSCSPAGTLNDSSSKISSGNVCMEMQLDSHSKVVLQWNFSCLKSSNLSLSAGTFEWLLITDPLMQRV